MANEFIGRRVSVGLGVESTPGTEVAPTDWVRQLKLSFQRKTTVVDNESALGRNEKINDSAITEEWAEGTLEGKVWDITIGYVLYNIFGTLVTTDNADSNPAVKDHTFDISSINNAKTLTVVRKDPLTNRRHGLATLDELEVMGEKGDWVRFVAPLKAKKGVSGADSAAYGSEYDFTSKHVTVKVANDVASLSGASALSVKSFKIKLSRPGTPFFPLGSTDPSVITTGPVEVTGELVLQYNATTLETLWAANTRQALSIAIVNTDVTIGAAARPSLTFTLPKVRLNTFEMSDDLDEVVEQTVGFKGELDETAGYLVRAVLVNTKASY